MLAHSTVTFFYFCIFSKRKKETLHSKVGPPHPAATHGRTCAYGSPMWQAGTARARDGNKSTAVGFGSTSTPPPLHPRPRRSFSRAPRKGGAKPTPARHVAAAPPKSNDDVWETRSARGSAPLRARAIKASASAGISLQLLAAGHAHGAIVPQLIRRRRPPPSHHVVSSAVQRCFQLLGLSARGPFPVGSVRRGGAAGRLRLPVVGRRRWRPGSCTWCVRAAAAAYAGRARRPGRCCRLQ